MKIIQENVRKKRSMSSYMAFARALENHKASIISFIFSEE
jgi:hypothetical protein